MVESSYILSRLAACGVIVLAIAIASCLAIGSFSAAKPVRHDDWRRTANGWERSSKWPKALQRTPPAKHPSSHDARRSPARIDPHPAVLALMQLTASLA